MITVDVAEYGSSLQLTVSDGDRRTDLHLAIDHEAVFETGEYGIHGFHVDAVTLDGTTLFVYASPDSFWTRHGEPGLLKRVELEGGVDSGDWLLYDPERDDVLPPGRNGDLLWERTED